MTRHAKLCLDFAKKQKLHEQRLDARVVVEELFRWGLVRVVDVYRSRLGSTERRPELQWADGLTKEEALAAWRTLKQLKAEARMQQCRESVRKIEQVGRCFSVALAPAVKQMTVAMDGVVQAFSKVRLPQLRIGIDDMVE
jgi:hypothetical protein